MALSPREVFLIIRAQDQASSTLATISRAFGNLDRDTQALASKQLRLGQAIMGIGVGVAAVGAAGIAFYADMAKASIEYNKAASLTLTQVRELGVSLEDIKDIGRRVGREVAVPFEQIQEALYDIFSSTDLSAKQAEVALKSFARAAVAGSVSITQASDAGISMLNGFRLPITELNRVMDVQFKTVQVGRISYDEFSATIGRAIPSAVRAGASIEELGGMMAFLTRNGLSAAMASVSAARAFDLISNPRFAKNMQAIGLSVQDANGNFKPMVQIVGELRQRFRGMSEAQVSEELAKVTKGAGGTIQAMRFLNLAVRDNDNTLGSFTEQIRDSAGEMDRAYTIMADTPAAKLQLLKNNWVILKTEIGDAVIPVMLRLVGIAQQVFGWINSLDPKTLDLAIKFGMIASAVALVVGVMVTVVGIFLTFSALLTITGISLGTLAATFGIVLGVIALVVAAVILLYKHWDTITAFWNTSVMPTIRMIGAVFSAVIQNITEATGAFARFWGQVIGNVAAVFQAVWNSVLRPVFDAWRSHLMVLWEALQFIGSVFYTVFTGVASIVSFAGSVIGTVFHMLFNLLKAGLGPAIEYVGRQWAATFHMIAGVAHWVWNQVAPVFNAIQGFMWHVLVNVLHQAMNNWAQLWNWSSAVVHAAWNGIYGGMRWGVNASIDLLNWFLRAAGSYINYIIDMFNRIPGVQNVGRVGIPQIPRLHSGGPVTGEASLKGNEVLRVLQVGEGVVSKRGMETLGESGLSKINRGEGGASTQENTLNIQAGAIQINIEGGGPDNVDDLVAVGVERALKSFYNELVAKKVG